jgi:hypothetical protein
MHCGEVFLVLVGGITGHSLRFLKEQEMIKTQCFSFRNFSLRGKNENFLFAKSQFLNITFLSTRNWLYDWFHCIQKNHLSQVSSVERNLTYFWCPLVWTESKSACKKKKVKSDRFQPINSLLQMSVKAAASLLLQEYLNNYAIDVHFRQKIFEL